jgi:hypothetical protein
MSNQTNLFGSMRSISCIKFKNMTGPETHEYCFIALKCSLLQDSIEEKTEEITDQEKSFNSPVPELKTEENVPTNFPCPHCVKCFKYERNQKRHIRIHLEAKFCTDPSERILRKRRIGENEDISDIREAEVVSPAKKCLQNTKEEDTEEHDSQTYGESQVGELWGSQDLWAEYGKLAMEREVKRRQVKSGQGKNSKVIHEAIEGRQRSTNLTKQWEAWLDTRTPSGPTPGQSLTCSTCRFQFGYVRWR